MGGGGCGGGVIHVEISWNGIGFVIYSRTHTLPQVVGGAQGIEDTTGLKQPQELKNEQEKVLKKVFQSS